MTIEQSDMRCFCGGLFLPLYEPGDKTVRVYQEYEASLYRCVRCSHIQFFPVPPEEVLGHFYAHDWTEDADLTADMSYAYWEEFERPSDKRGYARFNDAPNQQYLGLITRMAMMCFGKLESVSVLDVGCGFGGLVYILNKLGFKAKGIDINHHWLEQGIAKGNDKISYGTLDDVCEEGREVFDIILSHHSLEHMPAPVAFVEKVSELLAPKGIFISRLPSGNYLPALMDSFVRYSWCMYPAHLHYFTPRSVQMLSEVAGLKALEIEGTRFEELVAYPWCYEQGLRSGLPLRNYSSTVFIEDLARLRLTRELDFVFCKAEAYPELRAVDLGM